jgi:hypothetical protein
MVTRRVTIELPEEIADQAEAEAGRSHVSVDDIVRNALVDHLGWKAIEATRNRNADLDDESSMRMAREELRALRAGRKTA